MRINILFLILCIMSFTIAESKPLRNPINMDNDTAGLVKYVDPIIGTAADGKTVPAVGIPFGMTQWTPQSRGMERKCEAPYYYDDSLFTGFRGTHWLSGSCTQDYGSVTLMPISGKLQTTLKDYQVPFAHRDEQATPYYYKIELKKYNLQAEVTATKRCAMMRFTPEENERVYILVKPNSDKNEGFVKINAARHEIIGYNPAYRVYQGQGQPAGFSGYYVIQFRQPFKNKGTFSDSTVFTMDSIHNGKNIGAYVGYKMQKGQNIMVRIGTSFTSIAEARKNLYKEISGWHFDALCRSTKSAWQKALSKIVISGSVKEKRIFYTALYHTMQQPRLYSDADGTYPKFAHQYKTAKMPRGRYYGDFSIWDIYRAEIPLYEVIAPDLANDWVRSLLIKGEQGGWLPIFPCWNNYTSEMIGDHATAIIASAYNKGIRNYNIQKAYLLMRKNAFETPDSSEYIDGKGRRELQSYLHYGYLPLENHVPFAYHSNEQVSRTLEYAYDDYGLATVAKSLGKKKDVKILARRATNYKNVFDKTVGFMRGRSADGSWATNFRPGHGESYITEGTPRQYTFYVPQDIEGLTSLMGGREHLESALDSLFLKRQYNHGNEPDQEAPFLYDFTSHPWKSQKYVRNILLQDYHDSPGGLSGNDDAGEISAWYIFASLGFYPVDPVSNNYQLVTPLFKKATIRLKGKKALEIVCHRSSPKAIYIKRIKWDGKKYKKNYITHKMLEKGGKLEFFLQDSPSKFGSKKKDEAESGLQGL